MPMRPRGGQAHPVAPPARPLPLLVGRRAEGVGVEPAGVEPLEQALDRLALARAVGAGEEHDDGHARLLQLALRLEQLEAQLRHLGLELLLADAATELGGLEHGGILRPSASSTTGARASCGTYTVAFEADYRFVSPDPVEREVVVRFGFPSKEATYDAFVVSLDGHEAAPTTDYSDGVTLTRRVAPGEDLVLRVAYRSRGLGEWSYAFDLRIVAGMRTALVQAGLAQLVFLVLFSYAFFFEGATGLTVTPGAVLTLFVLMQLTARVDWGAVLAKRSPLRMDASRCSDRRPPVYPPRRETARAGAATPPRRGGGPPAQLRHLHAAGRPPRRPPALALLPRPPRARGGEPRRPRGVRPRHRPGDLRPLPRGLRPRARRRVARGRAAPAPGDPAARRPRTRRP